MHIKIETRLNDEDRDNIYEIMKMIGFKRSKQGTSESQTLYLRQNLKQCLIYARKNEDSFRPAVKIVASSDLQMEKLIDILRDIPNTEISLAKNIQALDNQRLKAVLKQLSSSLQSKYIRLNQKNSPMTRFVEAIRKPGNKKEIVSTYGALPKGLKAFAQPFYEEFIKIREPKVEYISLTKPNKMTEEEQIRFSTIKSKLEAFDETESNLNKLSNALLELQAYAENIYSEEIKEIIKTIIAAVPEKIKNSLTKIFDRLQSIEKMQIELSNRHNINQTSYQQKYRERKQKYRDLQQKYNYLISQLKESTAKFQKATAQSQKIYNQKELLDKRVADLEREAQQRQQRQYQRIDDSVVLESYDKISKQNSSMEKKIIQLMEGERKNKQIIMSQRWKNSELEQAKCQLVTSKMEVQLARDALKEDIERKDHIIQEIKQELRRIKLQPRAEIFVNVPAAANINQQTIQEENERLTQLFIVLTGENERLKNQLQKLKIENINSDHKLGDLLLEIQRLQNKLEISKQENLTRRQSERETSSNRSNAKKIEQNKRWDNMQTQVRDLRNDNQKLSEENRKLKDEIKIVEARANKFTDMVERTLFQEESRKFKQAQRSVNLLQQRNDVLANQNRSLQEKVSLNQAAKANDQSALICMMKKNYETVNREFVQSKLTINSLKKQLLEKMNEKTISRKIEIDMSMMMKELEEWKERHENLSKTYKEQTYRMNELIKETKMLA